MRRTISALLLLAAVSVSAAKSPGKKAALDKRVIGSWASNGQVMFVFKADGTGRSGDESVKWSAADGDLVVKSGKETQTLAYGFRGEQLVLRVGLIPLALDRVAAPSAKAADAAKAGKTAGAGGGQLSRLLLSSAWCSFSYNKVTGYSHSSRTVFSGDGTWATYSQGEGYSSGAGGTFASQHGATDGGRWQEQGGRILMSSAQSPQLAPVDMRVGRNSSGAPLITADGVEYASCR